MASKTSVQYECPIPIKDLVPDHGRVGDYGGFARDEYNNRYYQYEVGEIFDVCCVAANTKPLAGADLKSKSTIENIRKCLDTGYYDRDMYTKVLKFLNSTKIPSFQWQETDGNYLKCIYYNPIVKGSRDRALKLLLVLHTDYYNGDSHKTLEDMKFHIRIGHLLGYPCERIAGYLIRNIEYRDVTKDLRTLVKTYIKEVDDWEQIDENSILARFPIKYAIGVDTADKMLK
jgi:hypothetical protein